MTNEAVLDEIRRVRHAISAKINHDPHRIVAYYADLQQKHKEQIVDLHASAGTVKSSLDHGRIAKQ
jgi:hypothetical protein